MRKEKFDWNPETEIPSNYVFKPWRLEALPDRMGGGDMPRRALPAGTMMRKQKWNDKPSKTKKVAEKIIRISEEIKRLKERIRWLEGG